MDDQTTYKEIYSTENSEEPKKLSKTITIKLKRQFPSIFATFAGTVLLANVAVAQCDLYRIWG